MDLVLLQSKLDGIDTSKLSFNPYFNGSSTSTEQLVGICNDSVRFQSLF